MVTLLNFLAQILVHFSKTLEHQDHLVDLFSQCMDSNLNHTANFLVVKIIDFDYVKNPTIVQLQT